MQETIHETPPSVKKSGRDNLALATASKIPKALGGSHFNQSLPTSKPKMGRFGEIFLHNKPGGGEGFYKQRNCEEI
jgi:hypothetical protein